MITIEETLSYLHTSLPYEEGLVSIINREGLQFTVTSPKLIFSGDLITIKIEGMERYSDAIWNECMAFQHHGPVTCHLFYTPAYGPSFNTHTDPADVTIYCCEGIKTMEVDNKPVVIMPGEWYDIPAGTPHKATNHHEALTLSFGRERFLNELAFLHQDN